MSNDHDFGATQKQLTVMRNALAQMKSQEDEIKEYQEIAARLRWNKFRQLVHAGFTEAQAITLVGASSDLF